MIKVQQLSVSYDNKTAVDQLSVNFKAGIITGLIGPNGAGKSTLLKTCVGLISNYSGSIFYDDKELNDQRFWVKQNTVYAPENAELLPYLSGREFLDLIARIYKINEADQKIDLFIDLMGLQEKQNELVTKYSHGMQQKLSVAAALLPGPAYILIDEALNGMDSVSLARLFKYFKTNLNHKTIVISSHNVDLIQAWSEEIYVINHGRIIAEFDKLNLTDYQNKKDAFLNKYVELISP